jgi:8-oxo-dGTP diphosphatase
VIHVAVGVVYDKEGNILLTQRPADKHQGGLWEFAGGKVEQGETVLQALHREFDEELGIQPRDTRPLIKIPFTYPEYSVLLDVWEILTYDGQAHARENQAMRWVHPKHLAQYDFPAANRAIIRAAQLPHYYLITPDQEMPLEVFAAQLRRCFSLGIRLCRVRQGSLSEAVYFKRVHAAIELAQEVGAKVIVDALNEISPPFEKEGPRGILKPSGYHLTSRDLYHYQTRPVSEDTLLIASLHTEQDVLQANKIQVDCSVLSPVKSTASHPSHVPLGWEKFSSIIEQAQHPVYALGGLEIDDLLPARSYGAQGVAAIRSLWEIKERSKAQS